MKILFIACLHPKTGNQTTAERIRSYIEDAGHTCELREAGEFQTPADVADLVSQDPSISGALALHLFKAGRFLLDLQVPCGVIFGGTDINEDVKVEQKRLVMERVLLKARFAVAFTEMMKENAELYLIDFAPAPGKLFVLLGDEHIGGIQTEGTEKFCWARFLRSSGVSSEHVDELRVFLLVSGLRLVKDPLYLVKAFSEWHRKNPMNIFIIIGPKIDPVYTAEVESVVKSTAGVFLAQERSQRELHAAMKRCFALVNSSLSEGMSAAILEAMDLGLPVLARNIPGNAAMVQHEVTGLLFSSPQEFVHLSQRLLLDHGLRETIVRNGKLYVEKHHSVKQERKTYQQLVDILR